MKLCLGHNKALKYIKQINQCLSYYLNSKVWLISAVVFIILIICELITAKEKLKSFHKYKKKEKDEGIISLLPLSYFLFLGMIQNAQHVCGWRTV